MRRVIFYSVETFIDESHFRFQRDYRGAMVYTPPLMRKYRHVNLTGFLFQFVKRCRRCAVN